MVTITDDNAQAHVGCTARVHAKGGAYDRVVERDPATGRPSIRLNVSSMLSTFGGFIVPVECVSHTPEMPRKHVTKEDIDAAYPRPAAKPRRGPPSAEQETRQFLGIAPDAALRCIKRAVTHLSGLDVSRQSVAVQREHLEVLRELMSWLRPEAAPPPKKEGM